MAWPTIDYYLLTAEQKRKLPTPQAGGNLSIIRNEFTVTALALVTGAVSRVLWVPAGFKLWGLIGKVADLDTGAALVWDLGDGLDQDLIVAASTVGRSAGNLDDDDLAAAGIGYQFTVDSDILFTCTTQGSASQAGAAKLGLIGEMP